MSHHSPSARIVAGAALALSLVLDLAACADAPTRPPRAAPHRPNAALAPATVAGPFQLATLGGTYHMALGANAVGQIAGVSTSNGGSAVVWETDGTVTPLPNPAGASASDRALDINTFGQAAGEVIVAGRAHAALWTPPGMQLTDLNAALGAVSSTVSAVNDRGQAVGYFQRADFAPLECFLWTPGAPNGTTGTVTLLGAAGVPCAASDINTAGQVTGQYDRHAFLWTPGAPNATDGAMADLTPADFEGYGTGLNDAGQVTGYRIGNITPTTAFVWTPPSCGAAAGSITDLGSFLGFPTAADDINDAGYVVGYARDENSGRDRAFFWQDGTFTELPGVAGAFTTSPSAVTSTNLVVGISLLTASSTDRAALRWQVTPALGTLAQSEIEALQTLVTSLRGGGVLDAGLARSLHAKLDAALRQLRHPCSPAPANLLAAFANEVSAMVAAGRLTGSEAQPLLDGAVRAIASL